MMQWCPMATVTGGAEVVSSVALEIYSRVGWSTSPGREFRFEPPNPICPSAATICIHPSFSPLLTLLQYRHFHSALCRKTKVF